MTNDELENIAKRAVPDSHIAITVGYSDHWIVPYIEGIQIISSLKNAELKTGYGDDEKIGPLGKDAVFSILTHKDYLKFKFKALMLEDNQNEADT